MTKYPFGRIVPISRRVIAYIVDAAIVAGISILGGGIVVFTTLGASSVEAALVSVSIGWAVLALVLLAWFIVYTIMQAGAGSIGMRLQGIRLVRVEDGRPLGFGRALLRNIVFGLAGSIVVGYFTPLMDGSGRQQGWHDMAGKAVMIDARTAQSPEAASTAEGAGQAPPTSVYPVAPVSAERPPYWTVESAPGSGRPQTPLQPPVPQYAPQPSASGHPPIAPQAPVAAQAPVVPPVPSGMPSPPAVPPVPPLPTDIPPAPAVPAGAVPPAPPVPAPAAPATPAAAPTAAVQSNEPAGEAEPGADGLIAFVPGITQDQQPASSAPAPASAEVPAAQAEAPAAPPVPAAPAAPAVPSTSPAAAAAPVAPPVAPAPRPAAAEQDDEDLEATRISVPGHRLVFAWDDGTRVTVSQRTVFGRNPVHEDGVIVVPVRDETLSLSKTHFEAAAEPTGGWVLDRHSTNGLTIIRDGARIPCTPGERTPIRLGDALEIGDRVVTIGGYA